MRQHLLRMAGLGAAMAILALTPAAQPATTQAAGPLLILSPGSAQPGSDITISGSGFHGSEPVSLYWNGGLVTTLSTTSGGGFSYLVYLSTTAPAGPRAVLASGASGDQAGATFTVLPASGSGATATPTPTPHTNPTATPTPPAATATPGAAHLSLSPSSGVPGSDITISGSGFHAAESVSLYWNGGLVTTLPAATSGAFSYQVLLSPAAAAGPRAVLAKGSSGDQAAATFTVLSAPGPTSSPTPRPQPTQPASPTPRPQPTQPPGPTPTPPVGIPTSGSTSNGCPITSQQAAAEQSLFTLLNQHRAAAGAAALALNETLSIASRTHSCDMFQHQNLSHTGSDGSSPWQRIAAVGITFTTAGENIGMSGGLSLTAGVNTIDNEMMSEPLTPGDHHWNIVNAAYKQVGIGIIYANNQVWLTEDFIG